LEASAIHRALLIYIIALGYLGDFIRQPFRCARETEMVKNPMSTSEIPTEMRQIAEKSVEQAKTAFDSVANAARSTIANIESRASAAQAGAKGVGQKVLSFAEQNIASSFELAQKLGHAKNLEEVIHIQADYLKAQTDALAEQAKELGQHATKAAIDVGNLVD
jgi:phasin